MSGFYGHENSNRIIIFRLSVLIPELKWIKWTTCTKFIFGLGSTCATRCKYLGAWWTPWPRHTCLKGNLHSLLSAESLKNQKGYGMNWKQCVKCREKRQIKHTLNQGKWCNFIVWSLNVSYSTYDWIYCVTLPFRVCLKYIRMVRWERLQSRVERQWVQSH